MSSASTVLPKKILSKIVHLYIDDFRAYHETTNARVRQPILIKEPKGMHLTGERNGFARWDQVIRSNDPIESLIREMSQLQLGPKDEQGVLYIVPLLTSCKEIKTIVIDIFYKAVALYDAKQAVRFFSRASIKAIRSVRELYLAESSYELAKAIDRGPDLFPLRADGYALSSLTLGNTGSNSDIPLVSSIMSLCEPYKVTLRAYDEFVVDILQIVRKWGPRRILTLGWTGSLSNPELQKDRVPGIITKSNMQAITLGLHIEQGLENGPRLPHIQALEITMAEADLLSDWHDWLSPTYPGNLADPALNPYLPTLRLLGAMLAESIIGDVHINLYLVPLPVQGTVVEWAKEWKTRVTLGCDRSQNELLNFPALKDFDISAIPEYKPE